MAKKYDLSVRTGTYQDKDGVEKNRYETLGSIHSNRDNTGHFAVLSTARLLGIAHMAAAKGEDSVMVSLFQPDNRPQAAPPPTHPEPRRPAPAPAQGDDYVDDIPF